MTNSPLNEINPAPIRKHLADMLPNARFYDDVLVGKEHQPLLLLRTGQMLAAFAFASGDVPASYKSLYSGFKEHYNTHSARHDEWDKLDLNFVFCVAADYPQLNRFCSQVETDVYFCRKFVVPFSSNADNVAAALARLPFLPLAPLGTTPMRPPSAQTLLRQRGVQAILAKNLVVQHERGPERIVEDCIAGKFGEPRLLMGSPVTVERTDDRSMDVIRLESLRLVNFRAYRRPQVFNFGADVTVLYGPNGFGKTSLFDGIDFAATGGIGRADSRGQPDFAKTVRHLDAGTEESEVALTFSSRGVVREIVRSVHDQKHARLDGRATDRKAVLATLTGSGNSASDRVDHLVSLFRASHLFSQEQQELTKDFQKNCQLPADIVARMLAFEDYANAVKKVARVREILTEILAECDNQLRTLGEQIALDQREIERLGQTSQANANPKAIESELESLRAKVAEFGINTSATTVDASVIRGWRASLESRIAQCGANAERLTVLAREVAELPRLRSSLTQLQEQLGQKESSLNAASAKHETIETSIRTLEQQQAELGVKRAQTQADAESLAWLRQTQPQYRKLLEQQQELSKELERGAEKLNQLRKLETQAQAELQTREVTAAQLTRERANQHAALQATQAFLQSEPAWRANLARLVKIDKDEQEQRTRIATAQRELGELAPRRDAAAAEEQRLSRQIAEVDAHQSELRKLVSQLQGHVRDGHCPLCGEEHGSRDQLVTRIQNHTMRDGASVARVDLVSVRAKAKDIGDAIAVASQKHTAAEKQIAGFKTERERIQSELREFADKAASLHILLEGAGPTPDERARALVAHIQSEIVKKEEEQAQATNAMETAKKALVDARVALGTRQAEIDRQRATLARVQGEAQCLLNDPRLNRLQNRLSMDINSDALDNLATQVAKETHEVKTRAAKIEDELGQHRKNLAGVKNEIAALKPLITTMRAQLAQAQKAITLTETKLGQAQLPADSTDQSLLAQSAAQTRSQAELAAVRSMASGLELALDAATTAAALTTLREKIRNQEKTLAEVSTHKERHQPWTKYFEEVSNVLSSQQNEAIANFTRAYGPRTSVIQRRLRSVYGFDDLQVKNHDTSIDVRIMRNGEELRPIDYFSQSQQQTLLLGLFLTACSSQTWSAFAPVLLDDPVTHFDDLNTYAFLDLLVGLLGSQDERWQFILSTCDEKLFQLARQKFRYFGERAKFYRFTAIGADGPVIEEDTAP